MIIVDNINKEDRVHSGSGSHPEEPPPSYSSQSTTPTAHWAPDFLRPSNFVLIDRSNGSLRESWLIDPALFIPIALRPALPRGETEQKRNNLSVKTSNGSLHLDIFLAPLAPNFPDGKLTSERAMLSARTSNGSVRVKVSTMYDLPRLPFLLYAHSSNGPITVFLPRSFHGVLTLTTSNGGHKFSPGVSCQLTTFSDVRGSLKCFIGEYSRMRDDWQGDEVLVETSNGSIKVFYEDEAIDLPKPSKAKVGLFSRFFAF